MDDLDGEYTHEMCIEDIKNKRLTIDMLDIIGSFSYNEVFEIFLAAVKNNGMSIEEVINMMENYTKIVMDRNNKTSVEYIIRKLDYVKICLEAVKNNGLALQHLINLCPIGRGIFKMYYNIPNIEIEGKGSTGGKISSLEYIFFEAVKNNGMALKYVFNGYQNKRICFEAIKQDIRALKYVREDIFGSAMTLKSLAFKQLKKIDNIDKNKLIDILTPLFY